MINVFPGDPKGLCDQVTNREVNRLKEVYQTYQGNATTQAQWDPRNPGNRAILNERFQGVRQLLHTHRLMPLHNRTILDVGCGTGHSLASLSKLGAQNKNLHGIDLLDNRIAEAQRLFPDINFSSANAEKLEYPDGHFHLVFLFTVFSSILESKMARNVASEVTRVLRSDGAIVWYDIRYSNPRNSFVKGMSRSDIGHLFPEMNLHLHTTTLLPPLARNLRFITALAYPLLREVPFLRTHYLGLLTPIADVESLS